MKNKLSVKDCSPRGVKYLRDNSHMEGEWIKRTAEPGREF